MSDTTDNRPEGNDHSHTSEPSPQHETPAPAAHTPPAATSRPDVPPVPTLSLIHISEPTRLWYKKKNRLSHPAPPFPLSSHNQHTP
ncbi:hypothetical protein, partial [Microbacterium proteolyticum]|uniref:hypothetical protein n=1 Tax=Microbacterium proteolyticum TaxID=1572644 RepID=UPI001FACB918